MEQNTFNKFYNGAINVWLKSSFYYQNEKYVISDLCKIKDDSCKRIYNNYIKTKNLVKNIYFKEPEKKINRYKRAAVIVFAVISGDDPIEYSSPKDSKIPDKFFLKQRFAVYLALLSIVQDYNTLVEKPTFYFSKLGTSLEQEDDFLTSVYKDLFFSEHYGNYNVLTMANVFGLLVTLGSNLENRGSN